MKIWQQTIFVIGMACAACGDGGREAGPEALGRSGAALSGTDAVKFEAVSPWTSPTGSALALSSTASQGSKSLRVTTSTGWQEIVAGGLTSVGTVGSAFAFDLRPNTAQPWGEIRTILQIPSQGVYWRDLGILPMAALSANVFNRVEWPIPADLKPKLQASYSDLEIRIVLNAPAAQYLIDNGTFGGAQPSCSDGKLNGNETSVDCGGSCAPCGVAADGIVWHQKFTSGLGTFSQSGAGSFATAPLVSTTDYPESGSGSPAARCTGACVLTSPVVSLASLGSPLLRFVRLQQGSAASTSRLELFNGSNWVTARTFAQNGGNDGRWRTEFVHLENYFGLTNFRFRFVVDGADQTFQIDDVSVTDRTRVDGSIGRSFVMLPGSHGFKTWSYRFTNPGGTAWTQPNDASTTWQGTGATPFGDIDGLDGDNDWRVRTNWIAPPPGSSVTDVWLRTTFNVSAGENLQNLRLWAAWDDELEVYLNGQLVAAEPGWTPSYTYLSTSSSPFVPGTNTVAVHVRDVGGGRYFDLGVTRNAVPQSVPIAADPNEVNSPARAVFSSLIHDYLVSRGAPGAVFALKKGNNLVVHRAFGWADSAKTRPMPLNAVLRLASVDKPVKAAAVRALIADNFPLPGGGTLSLNTPVFKLLADHYGLTAPNGGSGGPNINQVTVRHLLQHTSFIHEVPEGGGFSFYQTLGAQPGSTTRHDNVRWVYQMGTSKPPTNDTTQEQYSSAGYMVLGYLVDRLRPEGLQKYMHTRVQPDVYVVYEELLGRSSREPWYATETSPYDRWINFEHYTGLASSARALAEFGRNFQIDTGLRAVFPEPASSCDFGPGGSAAAFAGGMAGTTSYIAQCRQRGISYGIIFNSSQGYGTYDDIADALWNTALSLSDAAYQAQ